MKRTFRTLATLALGCLAVGLSATALFNLYLKRSDDILAKTSQAPARMEDQRSVLDVQVAPPKDLLSALETPESFRVAYRVSDIPDSVKTAFAKATQKSTGEEIFLMAEPKAWPWNVGDVIIDGLPRRRMKAVAATGSLCLVFYEHGGFAKTDDVAAFRLSGEEAHAVWHSSFSPDVANPIGLRDAIRGNLYGDERY